MALFISSLLFIAAESALSRTDVVATLTSNNGPIMEAEWSEWQYCNELQYANSFDFKSQASQGDIGDDTAGNGIRLYCHSPTNNTLSSFETSSQKQWGTWETVGSCPTGEWFIGFKTRIQSEVNISDDTSLNCLRMKCSDGTILAPQNCLKNGEWAASFTECPIGTYICGFQEDYRNAGIDEDETALNGAKFRCCSYTNNPSVAPTIQPTVKPTSVATIQPINNPTTDPTNNPTISPTIKPTFTPTLKPTNNPTFFPTLRPTRRPTDKPTNHPSVIPTMDPIVHPTVYPTVDPTSSPTKQPTNRPTRRPTPKPTYNPTALPTYNPSNTPTVTPTNVPSITPTYNPTHIPTFDPTPSPVDSKQVGVITTQIETQTDSRFDIDSQSANGRNTIHDNSLYVPLWTVILIICCLICCFILIFGSYVWFIKKKQKEQLEIMNHSHNVLPHGSPVSIHMNSSQIHNSPNSATLGNDAMTIMVSISDNGKQQHEDILNEDSDGDLYMNKDVIDNLNVYKLKSVSTSRISTSNFSDHNIANDIVIVTSDLAKPEFVDIQNTSTQGEICDNLVVPNLPIENENNENSSEDPDEAMYQKGTTVTPQ
eukprot:351901_1